MQLRLHINQTFNDENFFVASMDDENPTSKNASGTTGHSKEKSKHEGMNDDRKNRSRDRKYSER